MGCHTPSSPILAYACLKVIKDWYVLYYGLDPVHSRHMSSVLTHLEDGEFLYFEGSKRDAALKHCGTSTCHSKL
jgi:hypothetical protein